MSPLKRVPSPVFHNRPTGHARPIAVVAAALMFLVGASVGHTSENGRAERLYTKGLAELHAGHREAAVALFEQAVEADPTDAHSLYYRALGYGHLGQYEKAVADLQKVVEADDPALERDRLELGYALYRLERYEEAATVLQIAAAEDATSAEANMLLGIVQTRRGDQAAASAALEKAQSLSPAKTLSARYYLGLAAYRGGNNAAAAENFEWVAEQPGDNPYAREANAFLALIRDQGDRPYRLHAGLAFEYDSNVALAPDSNQLKNVFGISNQADGRAVITAGGRYNVISKPNLQASFGYDFLQSLHFDLESYNVQTHNFGGQTHYMTGPITIGLAAGYEHSLLDNDSLLNGATVLPWLRYDQGDFGRTEVYYRMRYRNFLPSAFSPLRDGANHAAGARQFFSLGARDRNVIVGYRFDTDVASEAVGRQYNYTGNQFEFGLDWAFSDSLRADAIYAFKMENYGGASFDRDDTENQVLTRVQKRVAPYTWLTASYIYRDNASDQKTFQYDRHITSLGVELRY